MERSIGEKFEYNDITLEVIENRSMYCPGCYFHNNLIPCYFYKIKNIIGFCKSFNRTDNKNIIFKEIEK